MPSPDADSATSAAEPDTLDLILVASRRGRQAYRERTILQFPETYWTSVVFPTMRAGDTLVAAGVKSTERWGDRFQVGLVAAPVDQAIDVRHADHQARLPAGDTADVFGGTALAGPWELRALRTAGERADTTTTREHLRLAVQLRCRPGVP